VGKRVENGLFSMRFATLGRNGPATQRPGPQIRFAVSTAAYVGKAFVRNKVRRRAREALRSLLSRIEEVKTGPGGEGSRTGLDIVVAAKARCGQATYAQIYESLGSLLRMAGIY
jgi:RNase P protein component